MPQRFSSSGGDLWDTVGWPRGDPWATVGNLAKKIRRRPNGDRRISVRSPPDVSRVIERRSADAYKGRPIWRRSADARAATREAPPDHLTISTDDRTGIRRLPPGSHTAV